MPIIRPSSDLRNRYNDISLACHETKEPVYITKNGVGDLAIMSIELYDELIWKQDLHEEIMKGIEDYKNGRVESFEEAFKDIESRL